MSRRNMAPDVPPDQPVKKRHVAKPRPYGPKRKTISLGYTAGRWRHSKTGAEIEVEVEDSEVRIIREGYPTKTYKSHQAAPLPHVHSRHNVISS